MHNTTTLGLDLSFPSHTPINTPIHLLLLLLTAGCVARIRPGLLPSFHAFQVSRDPESAHDPLRRVTIGVLDAVIVIGLLLEKGRIWASLWATAMGIFGVGIRVKRRKNFATDIGIAGLAGSVLAVEIWKRNVGRV
jgi:hypothetical protein